MTVNENGSGVRRHGLAAALERVHGVALGVTLFALGACNRAAPRETAQETTNAATAAAVMSVSGRIGLPGDGGWDHIVAAPASRRLFVSHDAHVDVVDLDADTLVGTLRLAPDVHGVAVAADMGRGYSSNGGDSSLTVFDLKSLAVRGRIRLGTDAPDGIAYDSASRRVFAMHNALPSLSVIDAGGDTVRATVSLGGSPDGGEPDGVGHLFVTLKDKSELLVLNTRSLVIEKRWALAPCVGPDALTFDHDRQRILIGCDNRIAIEVAASDGHVVSSFAIGNGVDGIAVDPTDGVVMVACGDGTLTVAQRESAGAYRVLSVIATQRGARTQAFDPVRRQMYLPTATFNSSVAVDSTGRSSTTVPGSFGVMVVRRR